MTPALLISGLVSLPLCLLCLLVVKLTVPATRPQVSLCDCQHTAVALGRLLLFCVDLFETNFHIVLGPPGRPVAPAWRPPSWSRPGVSLACYCWTLLRLPLLGSTGVKRKPYLQKLTYMICRSARGHRTAGARDSEGLQAGSKVT